MTHVVTRFPPSPTGYFHIGSARTALFNFLCAAKNNSEMKLRFEDTDRARSKPEYEEDIREGLAWLGISYTLPQVFRQSERTELYTKHLHILIEKGLAYEAEPATDAPDKKVVRFKNPNTKITFTDLVRGDVSFDTTELGDFVIAKSISEPLYHLAVVVDDADMGITHVVRGEDHISNTPRQILILEALGFTRPTYAHIPLILAKDRSKLSKRHGAVSINEYRKMGFLPEALVNYLALLGWTPSKEKEVLSLKELIDAFDLKDMHKGGAVFDLEKLRWFNRQYLVSMDDTAFSAQALATLKESVESRVSWSEEVGARIAPTLKERISVWGDIQAYAESGEFDFFFTEPTLDSAKVPFKEAGPEKTKKHLEYAQKALETGLKAPITADSAKALLWDYADKEGRGEVLWPLRFALSGRERSPDPFSLISILGKEESVRRIGRAIESLGKAS